MLNYIIYNLYVLYLKEDGTIRTTQEVRELISRNRYVMKENVAYDVDTFIWKWRIK